MKGEDLFVKMSEIEDSDIELSETLGKRRPHIAAWLVGAAAALLIGAGIFAAIRLAGRTDTGGRYADRPAGPTEQVTHGPAVTVSPTEETVPPTDVPSDSPTFRFMSERTEFLSVTHAMLAGEGFEDMPFTPSGSGVYFGYDGEAFTAYSEAEIFDEPGNVRYELSEPVASFPLDLGVRAKESVADYIRRNLDPSFDDDDHLQLFGFMGENYIIFTGEPFHGRQASAIFYTGNGTEWTELASFEGYPKQITGGVVLSENEAYVCYLDRDMMMLDDYTPRRLTVYKTEDGGKTWTDVGLSIPEEYEGIVAPPTAALSPGFEGEHGVIPVTYSVYDPASDRFESHTAWFETIDGGISWEFHIPQNGQVPGSL